METRIDFILFSIFWYSLWIVMADRMVGGMAERANDRWINVDSRSGYLLIGEQTSNKFEIELEPPRSPAAYTPTKPTKLIYQTGLFNGREANFSKQTAKRGPWNKCYSRNGGAPARFGTWKYIQINEHVHTLIDCPECDKRHLCAV